MKVVLFCGGQGTRLREHSETIPKPLVEVGSRPIIWHLMRYYAHYGHKDFILCLGYRGAAIREYFLNYDPYLVDDFVLQSGVPTAVADGTDVADWTIRFVDTGLNSNIGQRLTAVKDLLAGERDFLANYSDCLSALPLDAYIEEARRQDCVASFVAVRPYGSFHTVVSDSRGRVTSIAPVSDSDHWINGGFMLLKSSIFDYMKPGEELVEAPFRRLIEERRLYAHRFDGFWKAMDTFKDKLSFDELHNSGDRPWEVWRRGIR